MLFKNNDALILNGVTPLLQQKRKDILEMLSAAVKAVQPYRVVKDLFHDSELAFPSESIDLSSFDHVCLVGFGKASIGMAEAVCDTTRITKGVVITNDPNATITHEVIEIVVGGHPLPNDGSIRGTEKILTLLKTLTENDCVLVLISGGGSSLFCKPRVPLPDLQQTIDLLIRSGATIEEVNTVRKHLSFVKGGQLAQQTKATMFSLIISDVIHDSISSIASGPTAPDPTTYRDTEEILRQYHLWETVPGTIRTVIGQGIRGDLPETLKEDEPVFKKVFNYIIANNEQACRAAVKKAEELGYDARLITTSLTGEAHTLGRYLVDRVKSSLVQGHAAFVIGGEPTVTVQGKGMGGRNQELVLGCLEDIAGREMVLVSFATDGIDGNSPAAGAIADGNSLERAKKKRMIPSQFQQNNDSYRFFHALEDTLQTGLTGTNVMDIQIILQ